MSPLPVAMRDRWQNRPEPPVGHGTVYWHALMSRYPEVRVAAAEAQHVLRKFDGFHLTPGAWLHMTTLAAGSTDDVSRDQLSKILDTNRAALQDVPAPHVALGKVLYHPEAVMLAVEPVAELRAIQRTIRAATGSITGCPSDESASDRWMPHVTVAYSTSTQPADQIIAALGTSITGRQLAVEEISLVVQWGPERSWDWETIGAVRLTSRASRPYQHV